MKEKFDLIEKNEEKGYKIWKIFNLESLETKYEIADYKTGKTLYTGTLEDCKKYIGGVE